MCNAYENGFLSLAVVENFVFPDEHQHGDAECTGLGYRDGQPDALDAQHEGQEDEGQQLEQQGAQEGNECTGHAVAQRREEGGAVDVEAHDEEEIKKAINAGARIIGVNNRDLKTFTVDISNSERLRKLVPENILFVAESGIKNNGDIKRLREAKVDAVLIGETFMKSENKKEMLKELATK